MSPPAHPKFPISLSRLQSIKFWSESLSSLPVLLKICPSIAPVAEKLQHAPQSFWLWTIEKDIFQLNSRRVRIPPTWCDISTRRPVQRLRCFERDCTFFRQLCFDRSPETVHKFVDKFCCQVWVFPHSSREVHKPRFVSQIVFLDLSLVREEVQHRCLLIKSTQVRFVEGIFENIEQENFSSSEMRKNAREVSKVRCDLVWLKSKILFLCKARSFLTEVSVLKTLRRQSKTKLRDIPEDWNWEVIDCRFDELRFSITETRVGRESD